MNNEIQEAKELLEQSFNNLSKEIKKALLEYYDAYGINTLFRNAKELGENVYEEMEGHGYGSGEMVYRFIEERNEIEEKDWKEIARPYTDLAEAYFNSKNNYEQE